MSVELMNEGGSPQGNPSPESGSVAASPAPSSAPQSTPEPVKAPEGVQAASPVIPPGAPPQWAPNFKFKSGGKEHEIPEFLRSVVKDAETEKQIRELHEKAYGVDANNRNLESTRREVEHYQKTIMPQFDNMKRSVDSVVNFKKNGDLDSMFEYIGIPQEAVAKWMYNKLQLQDLPPEQRAIHENERALQKRAYEQEQQIQTLKQTQEQYQLQSRATELQTALARPEVQAAADSYNSRMAQPDAFWQFVCQQADYMERTSGQRVSADAAIQQTMRILGTAIMPPQAAPSPQAPQGNVAPPIIPNVTGARNTSPTKKMSKSIEDLRKLSKEFNASSGASL